VIGSLERCTAVADGVDEEKGCTAGAEEVACCTILDSDSDFGC
jgi:hypothetical protein